MSVKGWYTPARRWLGEGLGWRCCRTNQPYVQRQSRFLTTDSSSPAAGLEQAYADAHLTSAPTEPILTDTFTSPQSAQAAAQATRYLSNPFITEATCTLYSFPEMEPVGTKAYPGSQLLLPMRKDILHRAVIYEGDKTRQGTANTKYRTEVHGSNRKIRPQKGSGSARLGNKKSPMLRGGGVAFGPKPRDFSTKLPSKIYDLAFRTALSYRYKMGQLIVVQGRAEIKRSPEEAALYMRQMLHHHRWGQGNGRSHIITLDERSELFSALKESHMYEEALASAVKDVDVKDLLGLGRLLIEEAALDRILLQH